MKRLRKDDPSGCGPERRGLAALIALACLSLAMIVGTLLLKAAVAERQYIDRLEYQHQAGWLVEAGLDRAAAQLANSPKYSGETWSIPAARLGNSTEAVVRIDVKKESSGSARRTIHVTADLKRGESATVHAVKEIETTITGG